MAQRLQSWQSVEQERAWLVALVKAMEQVSSAQFPVTRCDPSVLSAFGAQLASPAVSYPQGAAAFSLCN